MAYRPIVNFELLYGKNLVTSPTWKLLKKRATRQ